MTLAKLLTKTKTDPTTGHVYVVHYGFDGYFAVQHNQRPHLSVTGEHWAGPPMRKSERNLVSMGCIHDTIREQFPELAPLLAFHMCTAPDGEPLHYVANTVYLAGDRDHNGLRKGERKQIRNGKTGFPCWELRIDDGTAEGAPLALQSGSFAEPPTETFLVRWFPWCTVGEGKERELDKARSAACWPEATDAELSADPETLSAALLARLPALRERMQIACIAAGVGWPDAQGRIPE